MGKLISLQKVREEKFNNINCDFFKSNDGEIYMTINQLAEVLGYSNASSIRSIMNRNEYLYDKEFSTSCKLQQVEGNRVVTRDRIVFTEDGIYEVTMLSSQPLAREFRRFVRQIVKELRQTGSVTLNQNVVNPLDVLELMVQSLREQERQIQQVQLIQDKQQKNINQLNHIVTVKDNTTLRQQFNHSIKALAYRLQKPINETYNEVYRIINNNLHMNIEARAKNRGVSKIDVLEQENLLEYGLRIINHMFQEAS